LIISIKLCEALAEAAETKYPT